MMEESFCRWIIGGMAIAIVAESYYIIRQWTERYNEKKRELTELRALMNEEEGD